MKRLVALCVGLAFLYGSAATTGQEKADVETLVKQLKDKDEFARLKAAKLLGKLGAEAKSALPALTELLKDEDIDVRAVARNAIEAIRSGTGTVKKGALDDILRELRGKSANAKTKALEQLAGMGEEAKPAAGALIEIILDTPTNSRSKYFETLEKIDSATSKLVTPLLLERDLQRWNETFDMIEAAGEEAKPLIPLLRRMYLLDITGKLTKDLAVAQRVIVALVKIDPEDKIVIQTVLGALSTNNRGPTVVRAKALDVVKDLKADPKEVVKALISAMNDRICTLVVIDAIGSMGKEAKEAVPILSKLKFDQNATKELRDAASIAIQTIQEDK